MFVFSIQLLLNFVKLVLTSNDPNVQLEMCTLNGILKEWKFCDDLSKLNNEKNFISFIEILKKVCFEFKSLSIALNDFEMYSSIDIVILNLEKLIQDNSLTSQNTLRNIIFKNNGIEEEKLFQNFNSILSLICDLILIFKDCTAVNNSIKNIFLKNEKILIDKRTFYFEIDNLFLEVYIQIKILTKNFLCLYKLVAEKQVDSHEFIDCYTNTKKTFLKTIIYFVLLFKKRKIFFLNIQKYSKISKNTLEKIVGLFIQKSVEINESIKRILLDNHILYLKFQITKNIPQNRVFSNFANLYCYFKMEKAINYILAMIFVNESLPDDLKVKIKENRISRTEIKTNDLLYEESKEYFDFINTQNLLEWMKQYGRIYKENTIRKSKDYFELKNKLIFKSKEFLKILNNELESIKRLKRDINDFNVSLDRFLFQNIEKTFDLYCEWFSITFDYWYSFDIYFIKVSCLNKFFIDIVDNDYLLNPEKKLEFKELFNEILNNTFQDFDLGVDGYLFSYHFDWNDSIYEDFKEVFVVMIQKCIEIQNKIILIFELFLI
ncbi:hypothetical protein TUBRATIS_009440 [Tubulinosema ratisbonensis]|uniref:Uncharacterized protein n=1 Tax=Tubulinosema ratisbonensis TaxID=291195 RepID=A0A437AMW0_9MICR|nr:hypothetical protein TUBRATIS_009440 [Tubulinosema ratisbonensis]